MNPYLADFLTVGIYTGLPQGDRLTSLVAQKVKHLPTMRETQVQSLGQEDPLEKEIATHSSTVAWKIPWMEEPGRLQSMSLKESDRTDRLYFLFSALVSKLLKVSEVAQSCMILCYPMDCSYQAPLSMGFFRREYWSGLPFPSPGDLPDPGIEPRSPTLRADALPSEPPGKPHVKCRNVL